MENSPGCCRFYFFFCLSIPVLSRECKTSKEEKCKTNHDFGFGDFSDLRELFIRTEGNRSRRITRLDELVSRPKDTSDLILRETKSGSLKYITLSGTCPV